MGKLGFSRRIIKVGTAYGQEEVIGWVRNGCKYGVIKLNPEQWRLIELSSGMQVGDDLERLEAAKEKAVLLARLPTLDINSEVTIQKTEIPSMNYHVLTAYYDLYQPLAFIIDQHNREYVAGIEPDRQGVSFDTVFGEAVTLFGKDLKFISLQPISEEQFQAIQAREEEAKKFQEEMPRQQVMEKSSITTANANMRGSGLGGLSNFGLRNPGRLINL